MKTVDVVDHHVRFTTEWDGQPRYVFVPLGYVEADAGVPLSRAEAIDYVRRHLDRYRREAEAMPPRQNMDLNKIVTLER